MNITFQQRLENKRPTPPTASQAQGRALVRAIEALGTVESGGSFEHALARLLLATYKRRLQGIMEAAPSWVSEEILSAGERIGDDRAALWMSEN